MIVKVVDRGTDKTLRGDHFYDKVLQVRKLSGKAWISTLTPLMETEGYTIGLSEIEVVPDTSDAVELHIFPASSILCWHGGPPSPDGETQHATFIQMTVTQQDSRQTQKIDNIMVRSTCDVFLLNDQGKTLERLV